MLDHLLPLIYREFEFADEANKENVGYVVRRRARTASSRASARQTPPRPPRRSLTQPSVAHGVVTSRSLKRRREEAEEQRTAKRHETQSRRSVNRSLKRRREEEDAPPAKRHETESHIQNRKETELREKVEKIERNDGDGNAVSEEESKELKQLKDQESCEERASPGKQKKKSKKSRRKSTERTIVVSKKAAPKRIPLQDITHLYVNEHPLGSPRRELFPRLATSVAIRFF